MPHQNRLLAALSEADGALLRPHLEAIDLPLGKVLVEPAATILFNGVAVGTGSQGVLRLPAGRHQIRLESEGYQFRRMVNIASDAPATLEVDLEDEGLPLSQ